MGDGGDFTSSTGIGFPLRPLSAFNILSAEASLSVAVSKNENIPGNGTFGREEK
jgi:hypothetical protein